MKLTPSEFNSQEQTKIWKLLQKYEAAIFNHDYYGEVSGTEMVHLFDSHE